MKRASILAIALVLGGCYQSKEALIAPNAADYPLAAPLRYVAYEWNAATNAWDESEPGTAVREGDHYLQTPDGSPPGDAMPFSLKSIGGGYYIAQEKADQMYVYDLLKIEGDTIYEYAMDCGDDARKFVTQGLIDSIEVQGIIGNVCNVSSLDKLTQVFRASTAGRQPKGKFVIAR